MDLKTLESTSILAFEAVYNALWDLVPNQYRLPEDDLMIKDMNPFYDPELNFDNRLHYKLSGVEYPKRATPWFVISWNTPKGVMKSDLSNRRFDTAVFNTKNGTFRGKFLTTNCQILFAITSNSMTALYELQENFLLKYREKMTCETIHPHSALGKFPVSLNVLDSDINKHSRDKGTLCYLTIDSRIEYPIIGMVNRVDGGIIEKINSDIKPHIDFSNISTHDEIIALENDI